MRKRSLHEIHIRGKQLLWKLVHGITLRTMLKEFETMNDKAFTLAGMDWDYQGTVLDWKEGTFAVKLAGIIVRLAAPSNAALFE
ncbi:MAG: hypothetical protein V1799_21800 [bacterium]